jgi:hypothetical protein
MRTSRADFSRREWLETVRLNEYSLSIKTLVDLKLPNGNACPVAKSSATARSIIRKPRLNASRVYNENAKTTGAFW